jgi:hypothetical protein
MIASLITAFHNESSSTLNCSSDFQGIQERMLLRGHVVISLFDRPVGEVAAHNSFGFSFCRWATV